MTEGLQGGQDSGDRLGQVKLWRKVALDVPGRPASRIAANNVDWLIGEVERLRGELAEMQRAYDEEHHGMGVEGSDFAEYGGTYHDKDGKPRP